MNLSITADNGRSDYTAIASSDDSDGGGHTMYRVRIAAWVTATLLVLATNVPLVILIMKKTSRTFLDWVIIMDCMIGAVSMVCSFAAQSAQIYDISSVYLYRGHNPCTAVTIQRHCKKICI